MDRRVTTCGTLAYTMADIRGTSIHTVAETQEPRRFGLDGELRNSINGSISQIMEGHRYNPSDNSTGTSSSGLRLQP
ncbi:Uncharacterized protein TCM_029959 [Theobroma cacao]|uniref:Uncharacterized protein n=1 Tax=Theobroma cacao TaxID=3641 RepID=A0A061GG26_THECC|nr:Uncharacterized protein TCM_029959 [Theobroma cacao]